MLTFENTKNAKPIVKIAGGARDREIIYLDPERSDSNAEYFDEFRLPDDDEGKLQVLHNNKTEREICYIQGASGSGKSYWTSKYLEDYKRKHPKNLLVLFSNVDDDECLDKLGVKRIKLSNNLWEEPLKCGDFQDMCVIMDDVDSISDRKIRMAVLAILNEILQQGRHHNTTCLLTYHAPTGGLMTRMILNESHKVVVFLQSGTNRGMRYLLENYCGIDKDDVKKLKREKTRATCFHKNYPQMVSNDKMIRMLYKDSSGDESDSAQM